MKNVFRILLVMLLSAVSYSASAQLSVHEKQVNIGEEQYTYLQIGDGWAIEEFENGLNFWKPYPSSNYGNYKLFISNNGLVGIGKKPTTHKLEVNGGVYITGSYLQSSDARLKTNIQPLSNSLDKINKVRGVSFVWNDFLSNKLQLDNTQDMVASGKITKAEAAKCASEPNSKQLDKSTHFGVIAQELQEIFPELVKKDADGYLSVDYIGLVPVLIEAVKEQQKAIDKQTDELNKYLKSK